MKINIGDRVRFLNDVGGGKVIGFVNDKTVNVLNDEEFEVPVLINEIIVIDSVGDSALLQGQDDEDAPQLVNQSTQKKKTATTRKPEPEVEQRIFLDEPVEAAFDRSQEQNVYLAFVPKDDNLKDTSQLGIYLINDGPYNLIFSFLKPAGELYKSRTGYLDGNTKFFLEDIRIDELNRLTEFVVQVVYFRKSAHELREPVSKTIKIKPVRFYKETSYEANDFFNEKAVVYPVDVENMKAVVENLTADDIKKALLTKQSNDPNKAELAKAKMLLKANMDTEVVDLHIHELIDDERGLEPKEKLDIQLKHFETKLEAAIKRRARTVTFIHGVGNGTLKLELRRTLDRKFKRLKYQDASFQEYGYGATMVVIRK